MTPNLEERLCAAAYAILTDEHEHSYEATRWAARMLRRASHGRTTEFQSELSAQNAMRSLRGMRGNAREVRA